MSYMDFRSPVVSIITPAYNAARFIEDSIESALRQTFRDFELLVIDDGSTDDTAAIVQTYVQRDDRVRLSRQENRGIAGARNAALAQANGRFFALLDSDDFWVPTYLAEQLQILGTTPDIAVLSANAINFGGVLDGEPLLCVSERDGVQPVSLLQLVEMEDSMSIMSILRREVVDAIGGFDVNLDRSEDYDFWLRAAADGFRLAVNPKPLGFYRRRPDSVSADQALMLEALRVPLAKVREMCAERPDVQAAVDRQLARFTRRGLVERAKYALLQGDMATVAMRFADLADATGNPKYRFASWLSTRMPATIRSAYKFKRTFDGVAKPRRRSAGPRRRCQVLRSKPVPWTA